MKELTVDLGDRSYRILIGKGILDGIGKEAQSFGFSPKCAIISNPTVFELYGERVTGSIEKAGFDICTVLIPDGEEYKDLFWVYHILSKLLQAGLDRNSVIFALGGGVIGDITGFVASVYMRGISFIQIPTTLLSQVDSSVGGKTGVNHPLGKNMIGTFYQPRLVWIDVQTLETLPEREFLAGMAEVIKYGIIWDRDFFYYLKDNREGILKLSPEPLTEIIRRSCEIKAEVVSKDEREAGLRAILNYGHTVGHAVETVTNYREYLHGEAVAIGMVYEAALSAKMNMLSNDETAEIKTLLKEYKLPVRVKELLNSTDLLKAMRIDKKVISGTLRFILPEKIGKVRIVPGVNEEILKNILESDI